MPTNDVISSMTSLFISDSSTYTSYRETRSGSGTTLLDFFFDALIFIIIITGIIIIIIIHSALIIILRDLYGRTIKRR